MEEIDKVKFNGGQPIGTGTYGKVFKGILEGTLVAVKQLEKNITQVNMPLLRKADTHTNILRYYWYLEKDMKHQ